jgi:hypothetical protein
VARWLNNLGGSAKTKANKHGFLSGALGAAVRKHQLAANVCDGNRLPRDEAREMVFVTHEEFGLLHSCVGEHWQPNAPGTTQDQAQHSHDRRGGRHRRALHYATWKPLEQESDDAVRRDGTVDANSAPFPTVA